ncbi:tetratricopeptide repeat protein [Steroidobacter flavus]|uniref:Tetratricopeptide repeat protein n=1 Tax=Steroidobacter flavus TaxID=1842136 RepID=A0ABV8T7W5_9GAMM
MEPGVSPERAPDAALDLTVDHPNPAGPVRRELPPGEIVGRYRIVRLLGRGGMGSVYFAERADEEYQQSVALKVVEWCPAVTDLAGRFRAERQILARLTHENIARLLDGGQMPDGTPYLVMEHIDGTRIDHYCKLGRLNIEARLKLMQQVCASVQYAHQNLVIHRDLKPSNILVTEQGVVKLLDFGVAKLLSADHDSDPSMTQQIDRVLTPDHASPEQLLGQPVGTTSDIYALGVLLYELLSGKRPFEFANLSLSEITRIVGLTSPAPPSARIRTETDRRGLANELRGDLDNIVLKAMHRDPNRRYPSAAALAADIQNYLDGRPVQARPDTFTYRARKFLRRNVWAVAGVTASVMMIVTVISFYTVRLSEERDIAQRERKAADTVAEFMIDVFRRANPNETRGAEVTARDALDAAAARIDRDLNNEPRLRLALMRKMGQSYSGLGLMPEALSLMERQVSVARELFGETDVELARALEALGHVHHSMSKFILAEQAFGEAELIRIRLGLEHDAEWVLLLHSVATNLRAEQRFEDAIKYHLRAEQGARALPESEHATLGNVLQGMAFTYGESGDYVRAERYAREALPLLEGAVYEGHDLYGNGLNTLGHILRRQFKIEEAEPLFRRFVARQTEMLGKNHFLVARAQNNLATLLRAKADYKGAEEALLEALRIYQSGREPDQLDLAIAHHNLAGVYREAGDFVHALEHADIAIALKREAVGPGSPQLVSSLLERAGALRELGKFADAHVALAEAETIAAQRFDQKDRRHVMVTIERGRLNFVTGKTVEAQQDLEAAVASLRKQDEPARLAEALCNLAELRTDAGDMAGARTLLDEAATLRRKIMPAAHPALAAVQRQLSALKGTDHTAP